MIKTCHTPDEISYLRGVLQMVRAPGSYAEVGVWNGGTAKVIQEEAPKRTIHLFDTFEGILPKHAEGEWKSGQYAAHFPDVNATLGDGFFYHKGDICETKLSVADERFAFVHIDLDIYKPLADILQFFWKRLDGVMLVSNHDLAHPGVIKAVSEFGQGKQYSRYVLYGKS